MTSTIFRIYISALASIVALSLPLSSAVAGAGTADGADTDAIEPSTQESTNSQTGLIDSPTMRAKSPSAATAVTSTSTAGVSPAPNPSPSTVHPDDVNSAHVDSSSMPTGSATMPTNSTIVPTGFATGTAGFQPASPPSATQSSPSPQATPTVNADEEPHWPTSLETGNKTLLTLIESVSGKPNNEELTTILSGVIKISHEKDVFTFHRENGDHLSYGPGTTFGDKLRAELANARADVERYGSPILSKSMDDFHGVQVNGTHVEILRSGPEELLLRIPKKSRKNLPVKVKEVRLSRISLDLDESKGYPVIRNISGVEAVVWLGIDLHITPKEFWRTQNEKGDTTLTIGVLNPLPKALRMALGLKEISYFSHTVRKKQERVSSVSLSAPR